MISSDRSEPKTALIEFLRLLKIKPSEDGRIEAPRCRVL